MESKYKEIITIELPSIGDGETGSYKFQDDVLGEVLFLFSAQKDEKENKRRIEVTPEGRDKIIVTFYNAEDQKLNHSPVIKLTNENAPEQLYIEIFISPVDKARSRKWLVRFFKK